jgi:catechol 2,3-dioxygenase-like lactoylglutathione lyase family enzyme
MSASVSFSRIESIVLRVRSRHAAVAWYRESLGFEVVFEDPAEGMAVLGVGKGSSLTLWELPAGQEGMPGTPGAISGTFPIFEAIDVRRHRLLLQGRGVATSELREIPGLRCFTFWDPDGNRLDACEALEAPQL